MSDMHDFTKPPLVRMIEMHNAITASLEAIHNFMDSGQIWEARQALEATMVAFGVRVPEYNPGEVHGLG